MACAWLKALQLEQADAAEGERWGPKARAPKCPQGDTPLALCEAQDYSALTNGLLIAHFRVELAEINYRSLKPGIHLVV